MEKRVVIVDLNHLAHTYYHSQHRLSVKVVENGETITKDTTIQNGVLKRIHSWSNHGYNPVAVCFDRPVPSRKAYFQKAFPDMVIGTDKEYKGGREKMPEDMFIAIADVERILRDSGVSVFAEQGYEADDLVFACIQRAKQLYPGVPIDVVTNDADLLPLVDETVSVFLRSRKGTYAVSKELEKQHYIQVTPDNFQDVVEDLSSYKGFRIPYNSILLHKLLRGDVSDKIGRKDISRMFSASKYNAIIDRMLEDGVDFASAFRYGKPTSKILYKGTDKEFAGTLQDALNSPERSNLYQKICNSVELDNILSLLKGYTSLSEEQLDIIEKVYWGMNLNQTYPNTNPRLARRGYEVGAKGKPDIHPFKETDLHNACSSLQIRILR